MPLRAIVLVEALLPPYPVASCIISVSAMDELPRELVAGMHSIHEEKRTTFWYRFYDHECDIPVRLPNASTEESASAEENEDHSSKIALSLKLDNLSLRKKLRANQDAYTKVLLKEKVLSKRSDGYRFSKDKATEFLAKYGFPNAEIEPARVVRGQARFYLQLGNINS